MEKSIKRPIVRYSKGGATRTDDFLVAESPVEFRLGGVPIAVLMRTPGHDEALALGFALSESIVLHPDEFVGVERVASVDHDDRWDIVLADGVNVDPEQFRRNLYTTSSCGLCGKASIDAVRIAARVVEPGPELDEQTIIAFPDRMREAQAEFDATGGIHAAAAFTASGELLGVCEDIGRHNAVDKLIGVLARGRWPLSDIVLTVSGRVSFEIVQKAAVVGIPIVCGVSAASSLAAELGEEMGMTIVGFLRDGGFNVYAGPERLVGQDR
ncbi:MAG: formate dehydrogenase accessory sulfurtransferase FdhD [Actinomycetota bacterium]|nr:formate dehydrogenase accessory sulfurtransferase FdhD [Actinomycetota bacterium]